jgi:hypothetical protein
VNYYGTRLSENISIREPEGYLFCLNVPVARTGYQEYWAEELGLPGDNLIQVYRPEEEVFSEATMASFEAMPVTDDHPPEGVFVDNYSELNRGHVHNVRRGKGDDSDPVLADLVITDPRLIHEIMDNGKREISCGYTYDLAFEDGQYIQRQIRGNHVAVVDAGRAGHRVCIKDKKPERSKSKMKKSLTKLLARMAKDGDIEEVAEIIEELLEPEASTPAEVAAEVVEEVAAPAAAATEAVEDPSVVVEKPDGEVVMIDEATLEELNSKLDRILELLGGTATDEDPIVEEVAEAIEEALEAGAAVEEPEAVEGEETSVEEIAELIEEIVEPANEELDCGDPDNGEVLTTGDALRAALTAMHPQLKKMSKKQRQKACADIAAKLKKQRKASGKDSLASLAARSSRSKKDPKDLGKKIMASRNANSRK